MIEIVLQASNDSSYIEDLTKIQNTANPRHDNLFIVGCNKEIISFLNYFISESYNITIVENNEDAIEKIQECIPAAIIYGPRTPDFLFRAFRHSLTSML